MAWNYPDDFDDRYFDCNECAECESKSKSMSHAEEYYKMLVKVLYSKDEPVNPYTLENILEELGAHCNFESQIPQSLPTVQRVGKDVPMLYEINKELL